MLFLSTLATVAAFAGSALSAPAASSGCTAQQRLYYASRVPYAYSQPGVIAVEEAFSKIPFGVPDLNGPCVTVIYPNGGGPVPVGITGNGVVAFGTASRQVFSSVTGQYHDFGNNGTTVILTNVTLGVNSYVPVPITFSGQVYLDFNANCRITAVRAYAEIPTYIDGKPTDIYKLLPIPKIPI